MTQSVLDDDDTGTHEQGAGGQVSAFFGDVPAPRAGSNGVGLLALYAADDGDDSGGRSIATRVLPARGTE